jgi:tRNA A-37 threonylcarbamoyl transferase component Bud32
MQKQNGIPYRDFLKTHSNDDQLLYHLYFDFITEMKKLYYQYRFIHGDLILNNLFVDKNKLKLIDFGLSFIQIQEIQFMRYHVVPRLLKLNKNEKILKMNRIASIDICKLLYRHSKFSSSFQKLLNTCQGLNSKCSLTKKIFPNPIYIHSHKLTFDVALNELLSKLT